MKTKNLFFTAILLLSALFVSAEPVDPMRALETAEQFLPKKSQARRIKSRTAPEQSYEIVYTHRMPNSDRAAFYVVKLGEKGFVIISADDVANPILGYSYTNSWPSSISAEGDTLLPPQVLSYLNDMALQIETAIEKYPNLESSEEWNNVGQKAVRKTSARKSADALPDSVGPLLTTTWDRGSTIMRSAQRMLMARTVMCKQVVWQLLWHRLSTIGDRKKILKLVVFIVMTANTAISR